MDVAVALHALRGITIKGQSVKAPNPANGIEQHHTHLHEFDLTCIPKYR